MYLLQVKAPDWSKDAWDYFELVETNPAARPTLIKESCCPFAK
jgi:hypothetical protein